MGMSYHKHEHENLTDEELTARQSSSVRLQWTMSPKTQQCSLSVSWVISHFPSNPAWQDQLLPLVLKFDSGKHKTLEVPLMHIDLPHQVVVGDDVSGLLDNWATAESTQHLITVGIWYRIVEFLTAVSGLWT